MKLTVYKRSKEKKSELTKLRNEGDIPAVLYGLGEGNKNLFVKGRDFDEILRNTPKGFLGTKVLELSFDGKVFKVLVKEIQYHRTTYQIEHIDFLALSDERPVAVNVSIALENVAECVGVKKGGAVRQVLRKVKVKCLPKDIPTSFSCDITELELGQGKRLSDITFPVGVKPLAKLKELFVTVAKR